MSPGRAYILGQYSDAERLLEAVHELRRQGFDDLQVYMPYWVEGIDEALGRRPSRLPRMVLAFGLFGAASGYGAQWLLNAYLYPLNVGDRPPHFPVSFVPITFEMGILSASFAAFFGVLGLWRFWRLWDPVFEVEGFETASEANFWVAVRSESADEATDASKKALWESGASRVEVRP